MTGVAAGGVADRGDEALPAEVDDALNQAAQADVLLFATDFDGTIAPLQDDPRLSRALPGTVEALAKALEADGTTTAIVSGRDLPTLSHLTGAPEGVVLIASHGGQSTHPAVASPEGLPPDLVAKLDEIASVMTELQQRYPQARIERKVAAVVWHTRQVPEAERAAAMETAALWAQERCGIAPMLGKDVVECAVIDVTKGHALRRLYEALDATAMVYLGDDVTDETVFAEFEDAPGAVLIKVGPGRSRASARLDSPQLAAAAIHALAGRRLEVATRRNPAGD